MITRSADINVPDAAKLAVMSHYKEMAEVIKFIVENPDSVMKIGETLSQAYALSDPEKKERDDAVAAVENARSLIKKVEEDKKKILDEVNASKKEADEYAKKTRADAAAYRKGQEEAIKTRWDDLETYKNQLDAREIDVSEREKQTENLEVNKEDLEEKRCQHKEKVEAWEKEFSIRFAKLSAIEQEKFKS